MTTSTKRVSDNIQLSLPFCAELVSLFLRSCTIPSKWHNEHSMWCKFSGFHSRHCSNNGQLGYYTEQDKSILTVQTKRLNLSSGWLNPYINDTFPPEVWASTWTKFSLLMKTIHSSQKPLNKLIILHTVTTQKTITVFGIYTKPSITVCRNDYLRGLQ